MAARLGPNTMQKLYEKIFEEIGEDVNREGL